MMLNIEYCKIITKVKEVGKDNYPDLDENTINANSELLRFKLKEIENEIKDFQIIVFYDEKGVICRPVLEGQTDCALLDKFSSLV